MTSQTTQADAFSARLSTASQAVPRRVSVRRGETKYPFQLLTTGGPTLEVRGVSLACVRDAIRRYVRLHPGRRFLARDMGGGVRMVWRVA